eukprot:CAMPEP_0176075504 /NCGR_PEP_ID=MMETSP0120_2-20121206/37738_1 /TAXON_ID=160619 /ORGANISM="Kryptoperidinium foliaceum, Strain CCMP 1326" /LENGTH=355 /DNA_ID=CAMNT_0017409209 /DNA_START=60 /DNA_END=1124 /DNA_ORIENTATION=+
MARPADAGGQDEEPEMQESDVMACTFAAWYSKFRPITFKSEVIPLPEDFVKYLMADGIQAVGATRADDDERSSNASWADGGGDGESSSSDEIPDASFPELETQVQKAIDRLGGAVLPKLNWSAPKDARWLQNTLKCTSPDEVFMLLKASDFVAHDLCHSFDHCATSRTRPDEFTLVLRRWRDLHESSEFRCFVSDSVLFAVSQRQTGGLFKHLGDQSERDVLMREIKGFFEEYIVEDFPLRRYVFDVYVGSAPQRKMRLVDFSPWGPTTDPCLFDWPELAGLAAEARPEAAPEMRVVLEEVDRRPRAERYSELPLELAQLSAGEGLEDLIRKADDLLQQKAAATSMVAARVSAES